MKELLVAKEAAAQAGKILLSLFGKVTDIRAKKEYDFVTEADIAAEEAIIACIKETFPNDTIHSEELHPDTSSLNDTWILDGLDGTNNFVTGLPIFGVNVACVRGGNIIAAAVYIAPHDEMLWADAQTTGAFCNNKAIHVSSQSRLQAGGGSVTLGSFKDPKSEAMLLPVLRTAGRIRNTGAACYDLSLVARGVYDFRICLPEKAVDVAAPFLIIEKAGGRVTNRDGSKFDLNSNAWIASNGIVHDELVKLLNG